MSSTNSVNSQCGEFVNSTALSRKDTCLNSFNARGRQLCSFLLKKVKKLAVIILNLGIGFTFYKSNPLIFAGCVIVGMAWKEPVFSGIQKINDVWQTKSFNSFSIGCAGSILLAGGAFLSLPAIYLASSMFYAAYLGAKISGKAQEMIAEKKNCWS